MGILPASVRPIGPMINHSGHHYIGISGNRSLSGDIHLFDGFTDNLAFLIPLSIGLLTLSLLTFLGNAMVVHAIRTERKLHTVSNMFILSLAIADLIVGLMVMPLSSTYVIFGDWILGLFVCQLWLVIDYTASTASIFNLLILSLDRYWSIRSPLKYLCKRTKKRALAMIGIVWMISALWAIPIIGWHLWYNNGIRKHPNNVCETEFSDSVVFKITTSIANFLVPMTLMMILYYKIYREIKRRGNFSDTINHHHHHHHHYHRHHHHHHHSQQQQHPMNNNYKKVNKNQLKLIKSSIIKSDKETNRINLVVKNKSFLNIHQNIINRCSLKRKNLNEAFNENNYDNDHCDQCGGRRKYQSTATATTTNNSLVNNTNNQQYRSNYFPINLIRWIISIATIRRKTKQSIEQQQQLNEENFIKNSSIDFVHHSINDNNIENAVNKHKNSFLLHSYDNFNNNNNDNNNNNNFAVIEKCSSLTSSSLSSFSLLSTSSSVNSLSKLKLRIKPKLTKISSNSFPSNKILKEFSSLIEQKQQQQLEKIKICDNNKQQLNNKNEEDEEDDDDDDITEVSPPLLPEQSSSSSLSSLFLRDIKREKLSHDNGHRVIWNIKRFDNLEKNSSILLLSKKSNESINENKNCDRKNFIKIKNYQKSDQKSLSLSNSSTSSMFSSSSSSSTISEKNLNESNFINKQKINNIDMEQKIAYYNELTLMRLKSRNNDINESHSKITTTTKTGINTEIINLIKNNSNEIIDETCSKEIIIDKNLLSNDKNNNEKIVNDCDQKSLCKENQITASKPKSSSISLSKSFCLLPENHFSNVNVKVEYIDFPLTSPSSTSASTSSSLRSIRNVKQKKFTTKSNNNYNNNSEIKINLMNVNENVKKIYQKFGRQRSNSYNNVCGIIQQQQKQKSNSIITKRMKYSNVNNLSTKSLNLPINDLNKKLNDHQHQHRNKYRKKQNQQQHKEKHEKTRTKSMVKAIKIDCDNNDNGNCNKMLKNISIKSLDDITTTTTTMVTTTNTTSTAIVNKETKSMENITNLFMIPTTTLNTATMSIATIKPITNQSENNKEKHVKQVETKQLETNNKFMNDVKMDKLSVKNYKQQNCKNNRIKKSDNTFIEEKENKSILTLSNAEIVIKNRTHTLSSSSSSSLSPPKSSFLSIPRNLPIENELTSYGSSTNQSHSTYNNNNNQYQREKSKFPLIKSAIKKSSLIPNNFKLSLSHLSKNNNFNKQKKLTNNSFYDSFRMKSFRLKMKRDHNHNEKIDSIETTCNDEIDDLNNMFIDDNDDDNNDAFITTVDDGFDYCKCKNKNKKNVRHQTLIVTAAQKHRNELKREESSRLRQEKKAARQLGVILGAFILCWMPYIITYVVTAYCTYCISLTVHQVTIWLGYLNSFLNPFLYALCNENFKHAFKKMLGRFQQPQYFSYNFDQTIAGGGNIGSHVGSITNNPNQNQQQSSRCTNSLRSISQYNNSQQQQFKQSCKQKQQNCKKFHKQQQKQNNDNRLQTQLIAIVNDNNDHNNNNQINDNDNDNHNHNNKTNNQNNNNNNIIV